VNVPIGLFTVDFHWPEPRLVVEVDGFRAHGSRIASKTTASATQSSLRSASR
jgi:very-short-patch-repair endonuclease